MVWKNVSWTTYVANKTVPRAFCCWISRAPVPSPYLFDDWDLKQKHVRAWIKSIHVVLSRMTTTKVFVCYVSNNLSRVINFFRSETINKITLFPMSVSFGRVCLLVVLLQLLSKFGSAYTRAVLKRRSEQIQFAYNTNLLYLFSKDTTHCSRTALTTRYIDKIPIGILRPFCCCCCWCWPKLFFGFFIFYVPFKAYS